MNDFDVLKKLIDSDDWPLAVDPTQICESENDKLIRADWILDVLIDEDLKGKIFLDYGSGEGHVAIQAAKRCSLSFAYDIIDNITLSIPKPDNFCFYNNILDLNNCSSFDVILLHDVLDHVPNPIDVLRHAKSLLSPDGTIYARMHPFCSRHGMHLYKQLNKGFIHLIFKEDEIRKLELTPEKTLKIIHPLATYSDWIKQAGLKSLSEFVVKDQKIESFFSKTKIVRDRIVENWKSSNDKNLASGKEFPEFQMRQGFINYKLK